MPDRASDGRCPWAGDDPLYVEYHDTEWGRPVKDDRRLFEKLCLESFQAGLSWLTILRKRENFRNAFDHFDPALVKNYGEDKIRALLKNEGIIRHRGKIEATIFNAALYSQIQKDHGSFAQFIWQFEPREAERPSNYDWKTLKAFTQIESSARLAKALKSYGWKFVGPVNAYAFMQSMGLVNDHVSACPCRQHCEGARQNFKRP